MSTMFWGRDIGSEKMMLLKVVDSFQSIRGPAVSFKLFNNHTAQWSGGIFQDTISWLSACGFRRISI